MKAFTIKEFNTGKKAKYRNGYDFVSIACDPKWRNPFITVNAFGNPMIADKNGRCGGLDNEWDLMLDEPDEVVVSWVNFYGYNLGNMHETKQSAVNTAEDAKHNVIAILKITWDKSTDKVKIEQE